MDLEIRLLRHKLSSHGTDYLNPQTGEMEAHVPIRFELQNASVSYVSSASRGSETVDLQAALEAHFKLMIDVMDEIIDKSIDTIYKRFDKKKIEFGERLSELRIEKEGGLVIGGVNGGLKIIVTFVSSK
jgi:hypothetical protein